MWAKTTVGDMFTPSLSLMGCHHSHERLLTSLTETLQAMSLAQCRQPFHSVHSHRKS